MMRKIKLLLSLLILISILIVLFGCGEPLTGNRGYVNIQDEGRFYVYSDLEQEPKTLKELEDFCGEREVELFGEYTIFKIVPPDNNYLLLSEKQNVYGCYDYRWTVIK